MPRTAALALALSSGIALAQADAPSLFVANDGNLEGSVTSLAINPDGSLTVVDRIITGTRPGTSQPCPGCNPFAIDLTPDGRFLATNHASGNTGEQITVYAVAPDGTLSIADVEPIAEGGLDIAWVRDDLLAVCITDLTNGSSLRLYAWDGTDLTLADSEPAGSFFTSVAVHPNRAWIYANDSFANTIRRFDVTGNDATLADTVGIPVFGIALAIDPSGKWLYAAGGISAGGNAFAGYQIDASTGALSAITGSPFTSPGDSPKGFAISPDSARLFVSHGGDATIHVFDIDPATGAPANFGQFFDVGSRGSLQGMTTLGPDLFALDDSTSFDGVLGVYSFIVDPATGSLTPRPNTPVPTQGIGPMDIVAWAGAGTCAADFNDSGAADVFDILDFLAAWQADDPATDLDDDGMFTVFDILAFLAIWEAGCP